MLDFPPSNCCRWSYGEPSEPGFSWCAKPVARSGGAWCEEHLERVRQQRVVALPARIEEPMPQPEPKDPYLILRIPRNKLDIVEPAPRTGRLELAPLDLIEVVALANPKKPRTRAWDSFAQYYRNAPITVAEYRLRVGLSHANTCLRYDLERGYIRLFKKTPTPLT